MTKKEVISCNKAIAYYSGFGGIEIYHIEHGINDAVYFTSNAWNGTPRNKPHKAKINYNSREPYFNYKGYRIPLNECIRTDL